MSERQIQSVAFRTVAVQSERLRIFGVLAFVAAFVFVTMVRVFVIRTAGAASPWVWGLLLAVTVAGYAALRESSAEIIARLYESASAFSQGTKQQHDLTAVVIKRL